MAEERIFLGFDIGGTKIGIGIISESGKFIAGDRIENKDTRPEDILPLLVEKTNKLFADNNLTKEDIVSFGISSPGPADYANGIMTTPPNNPLWRDVPILKYLSDNLGIRGYFENDANAAALAEGYFGAGKGAKDYVYLTMSTGIGAGIIAGGTLVQGSSFQGGEFGHSCLIPGGRECSCGLRGCYEAYCGGRAVARDLQKKLADKPDSMIVKCAGSVENIDMKSLQEAVEANDEFAVAYWDEMIERNAQALGSLVQTINPAKIILGTFAWAAGDLFMKPLREKIVKYCWAESYKNCEIVPSALRRDIGYYAGAAVAMYFEEKRK